MEKENQCCDMAMIERGQVVSVSGGLYKIRSYGRDGLTTPGIPPMRSGDSYNVNDKVYFFLFSDGHGAVLGKFT